MPEGAEDATGEHIGTARRTWRQVAAELHRRELEEGRVPTDSAPLCGQSVRNIHDAAINKLRDQLKDHV